MMTEDGPVKRRGRLPRVVALRSRTFFLVVGLVVLALAAAIVVAARPGVPRTVVMATGFKNGAYHRFALDYRAVLARHGVALELRETRGAPENLKLIEDPASGVQIALLQSGVLNAGRQSSEGLRESLAVEHPDLVALGTVFHEPLWIFHKLPGDPERLSDLVGKRVAIGGVGTGSQVLLRQVLPVAGLDLSQFEVHEVGGGEAVAALASGKVDAVMLTSAESSSLVGRLAAVPEVKLMSLAHAEALTRRLTWLARVTLPRGALDLARDLPPRDVTMISPMASLVARRDLHPAVVLMLLEAGTETHGEAGLFQRLRQFPSIEHLELPIDPDAQRYLTEGPSLLHRWLPFAVATIVRRLYFILPAAALLLSILKYAPQVYAWWMSQRIYRWYGQLRTIEDELDRAGPDADVSAYVPRVERLDDLVLHLSTPLGYSDRVYTLREHINLVRNKLERHRRIAAERAAERERRAGS
jgi:TRAP transporter TAXI family solute receptor